MRTEARLSLPGSSIWPYVWLGVVSHLIWGSYPVLAKRAVAEIPKFSLLFCASLAATLVALWLMRSRERLELRQAVHILRRQRVLWGLALFVVLRSVTNILAIALTQAVWVQLIYMLTPFMVAILGALLFGEPAPPYTYRALLFSTTGAALMLVQDWSHLRGNFNPQDLLGMGTALASALALAFYYQYVRRCHLVGRVGNFGQGLIMFQQGLAMATTFLALTLLAGEDWSAWSRASSGALLAALAVIWGVQVGGNLIQITSLSGANPALVTSLMALRLISALALGWLILREQLAAPAQWLGAVLVVATVTLYLWLQRGRNASAPAG